MNWQEINGFYFEWPWMLLALLLIPLWWWLYLRHLKAGWQKTALHFSYVAVVQHIQQQPAWWKRLLFPLTLSWVMLCLVLALARPTVGARVPVNAVDMMLVLDISLSMMADDIRPNRLEAAKTAAVRFVETLPRDVRVGLEVFAGDNYVLSPPTSRHREISAYLRALRQEDLKPRTEIGSALHTALKILETPEQAASNPVQQALEEENAASETPDEAVKPDRVIVLLSDGDSHEGYPWEQAARDAVRNRVMIHTIGVGSSEGVTITYQGTELPVSFSETTLQRIADIAEGNYFRVFKETDFRRVYEQIHERTVRYEEREVDLGFACAGLALLALLGASVLALKN